LEVDDLARVGFRERFSAFTVDEYQDVNLLQQTLLDLWLGGREDLAVVGDDYQSIYGFTGATPLYLLDVPKRFSGATVVRLETNYRSTPEILGLANRLTPRLEGAEKTLRAARPSGPEPVVQALDGLEETAFVVKRVRELAAEGVLLGDVAVLYRTNARSAGFEQAFTEAGIPFQMREGGFLSRQAVRRVRARLKGSQSTVVAVSLREAASREGLLHAPPKELGEQERVRQADLSRLVDLAERFDDGERTVADFFADLEARFGREATAERGVQLLTYHRAKGLEFEAVFLPRLEEKELPIRQAREPEEIAEERRLFYVGLTRAKRRLFLTWSQDAKPSRFLGELGVAAAHKPKAKKPAVDLEETPTTSALRRWRRERAQEDGVPAYVVMHDTTLVAIAERRPSTKADLASVPGIGPAKLDRYGDDLLATLAASQAA
jgi:DNA helicase-2/ATP-dependent DNA helicase PcrA